MSYEPAMQGGGGEPIERTDTGIRILLTVLFVIVARVIEMVLLVVILFELAYTLATRRYPAASVRHFANRTIAYFYRIARYLTYNEDEAPFPFRELPPEVEPPHTPTGAPRREPV